MPGSGWKCGECGTCNGPAHIRCRNCQSERSGLHGTAGMHVEPDGSGMRSPRRRSPGTGNGVHVIMPRPGRRKQLMRSRAAGSEQEAQMEAARARVRPGRKIPASVLGGRDLVPHGVSSAAAGRQTVRAMEKRARDKRRAREERLQKQRADEEQKRQEAAERRHQQTERNRQRDRLRNLRERAQAREQRLQHFGQSSVGAQQARALPSAPSGAVSAGAGAGVGAIARVGADADGSTWICPKCTFRNASVMPRCEMCDESKPAVTAAVAPAEVPLAPALSAAVVPRAYVAIENEALTDSEVARRLASVENTEDADYAEPTQTLLDRCAWQCERCTFINDFEKTRCEQCNAIKPRMANSELSGGESKTQANEAVTSSSASATPPTAIAGFPPRPALHDCDLAAAELLHRHLNHWSPPRERTARELHVGQGFAAPASHDNSETADLLRQLALRDAEVARLREQLQQRDQQSQQQGQPDSLSDERTLRQQQDAEFEEACRRDIEAREQKRHEEEARAQHEMAKKAESDAAQEAKRKAEEQAKREADAEVQMQRARQQETREERAARFAAAFQKNLAK